MPIFDVNLIDVNYTVNQSKMKHFWKIFCLFSSRKSLYFNLY